MLTFLPLLNCFLFLKDWFSDDTYLLCAGYFYINLTQAEVLWIKELWLKKNTYSDEDVPETRVFEWDKWLIAMNIGY